MKQLLKRGEQLARDMERRRLEQIAAGIRDLGVSVASEGSTLVLTGRKLIRRWLSDPALRFVGRLDR